MAYKDKDEERRKRKENYYANRDTKLAKMKEYRDNRDISSDQKEIENLRKREYHLENRERNNLRRAIAAITEKYKVSYPQALDLFHRSTGVCDSCGDQWSPNEYSRRFHIDHDHSTGEVRGILCHRCNTALGMLMESHKRIEQLTKYLEVVCGKPKGK
jgi:hypothetical protein